ncbi:MAG: DUF5615 family PIN-like protein [Pyrinomonadaceae bacterium]
MRVLLDECVTRNLRRDFVSHEVHTIEEAGFKGLRNGALLRSASGTYDVLVTVDQNLRYQQNLTTLTLAVIVIRSPRSTYPNLALLMPQVLDALEKIKVGDVVIVS